MSRIDRVEAIDRQSHRHPDWIRVPHTNRILPPLQCLDIPAPVMQVTSLRNAAYEDLYLCDIEPHRLSGDDNVRAG
jgi:hypothetical protein